MKLGPRQEAILTAMVKNGGKYWPGCGIVWGNFSTTRMILESLAAKKLITNDGNNRYSVTKEGTSLGDPYRYIKERVAEKNNNKIF
ncbi:hypothetical protein [Klebsiella pneumoniae]|uniref:hypothetical protein n=1 Tax=Klebsiella pneumoniae TaxID=573 RepID=UPI000D1B9266|nr:hypothetical protein [Klebsiella pneumoniae]HCF8051249.1 hypothetical protein [Klebsiella pneumoniae]